MKIPVEHFLRQAARVLACAVALGLSPGDLSAAAVTPPVITRQPVNQLVLAGQDAAFSVTATGNPPIFFQWRRENVNIPRGTNADFFISFAQTNDAGKYTVLVTDGLGGSVMSSQAMLTVTYPISIINQPQPQTAPPGGTAQFWVTATGPLPVHYQWMFNGSILQGATNQLLTLANLSPAAAGAYSVRVWNSLSFADSLTVLLSVAPTPSPPVITAPPASQTVAAGSSVYFSDIATGAPPLAYQWTLNGASLAGATNQSLMFSNVLSAAVGSYAVRVSNPFGTVESAPATLSLAEPLVITVPPARQTAAVGSNVIFSVNLTGALPIFFQWYFNSTVLAGATNQSLTLTNLSPADAGTYSVRVSNPYEAVDGGAAMLTVTQPPVITTQPAGQSAVAGAAVTFSVAATGSTLTYQWTRNGTVISNATGPSFTLASARMSDAGNYRVVIQNDFGTLVSDPARLEVTLADLPFADNFAEAGPMPGTPYFAGRGTNFGATREPNEPPHNGQKAVRSVWLSWTAPASGIVSVNTLGSDFDTVLAIYTGGSVDALTAVESDDDSGAGHTSALEFNAVAGTTYRLAVAGDLFAEGNITLELDLSPTTEQLPHFLSHPRHYAVAPGGDAVLQFNHSSTMPVQIEWLFMGTAILNQTLASNSVRSIDDRLVGAYRVRLTTPTRTIYSRVAEIQINSRGQSNVLAQNKLGASLDYGLLLPAGAPAIGAAKGKSANLGGSGNHGYTTTQIFSTSGADADPGEPVHCGVGGGHSEWFTYQAEADGTLRINTDGSNFDTVLAVYIGPGNSYATLTNVACDNNSGSNGLTSKVVFSVTQGTIYWIAVDGVGSSVGTVHLNLNLGNPVSIASPPQSQTAPSGTNVSFSVAAGGMTNYAYQWRFGGTNLAGATNTVFTRTNVPATLAGNYDVVVKNPINSTTSSVAVLTVYSGTINITNQPPSRGVTAGTNVTFTVGAGGAGTLRYQWRFNGSNLANATNSSLALANVQATNAGAYAVNVTDANGALLSSNATLSILAAPVITLQPASLTYATGAGATLTAAASGTPTPGYQWLFNGTTLAGATLGTLTIGNFQSTNEGVYALRASNSVGIATSTGAELLLNAPLRFANCAWSNGVFGARLIGGAGSNYLVQCSTNATQWSNVATNSSASGISSFLDPGTNSGCRMFRALAP